MVKIKKLKNTKNQHDLGIQANLVCKEVTFLIPKCVVKAKTPFKSGNFYITGIQYIIKSEEDQEKLRFHLIQVKGNTKEEVQTHIENFINDFIETGSLPFELKKDLEKLGVATVTLDEKYGYLTEKEMMELDSDID